LRNFYLQAGFPQAENWPVIHHGFEFSYTQNSAHKQDSDLSIVIVGRLVPRKGIMMALRIFKKLKEKVSGARLSIVGDGSQRRELEQFSSSEGLNDAVRFEGFQANPQNFLSESDQVWVPSYAEGLPLVIFEAMHAAKPIVAFDTIGSKDLIQHGQNGMLASAFDEAEFLQHALWLHQNPVQSGKLGAQAKQDAEANFSLQSMGENTLRFYQQVLA
jgi:glycosyltransferase involved in cell wall biosynthesis